MSLTQVDQGLLGQYAQYTGFKNRIINGAMVIDQRNAGGSVTPANGDYTVDRWQALASQTGKYTLQQVSDAPAGFKNSLKVTSTSAYSVISTDRFMVRQLIEGNNWYDLAWGTSSASAITISFWVKSSLTGYFGGSVVGDTGVTASYTFGYTISSANTWEQKTITIPGYTLGTWTSGTSTAVQIEFGFGVGSNRTATANAWNTSSFDAPPSTVSVVGTSGATFQITGVQLEKGSTATSFDYRPYGTELQLCQRYYYKEPSGAYHSSILDGNASDYPAAFVTHPVDMRTTPTTVFENLGAFYYNSGTGSTSFTPSGGSTTYAGNYRLGYSFKSLISNGPGTAQNQKTGQWFVQLSFSAEL